MTVSASGPTFSLGDFLAAVREIHARAPRVRRGRRVLKVSTKELILRAMQARLRGGQRLLPQQLARMLREHGMNEASHRGPLRSPDCLVAHNHSASSVHLIARSVLTAAPPVLLLATAGTTG